MKAKAENGPAKRAKAGSGMAKLAKAENGPAKRAKAGSGPAKRAKAGSGLAYVVAFAYNAKAKERLPAWTGKARACKLGFFIGAKAGQRLAVNLVLIVFLALIAVGMIHGLRAIIVDSKIRYTDVPFASAAVPESLDGYTIAFVTDVHDISGKKLEQAVEEINRRKPDLLLLGGDFSTRKGSMKRDLEILSEVNAADGIYGVGGTHDNKIVFFPAMRQCSMHPLSNSGVRIKEGFYLAGVDDPRRYSPDIEKALEGAAEGDFVLLLSHEPDNTMTQGTASVDLVLSGHTHGGHVTLFGKWAPALTLIKDITKYGQRFMSGWASSRDGTPVYVSNGTGSYTSVPRSFAQPEVVFLRLEAR